MQNQDPLNPVDSTEYATQLATFSSVEQQVQTNDLLRNISAALGGNTLQEVGQWIGMEGLVRAPVAFTGAPVTIRPDYAEAAEDAVLVVRDGADNEVQRIPLEAGQKTAIWSGKDASGGQHPAGAYSFAVESYAQDELISTQRARVYSRIEEVRDDNGTVTIRFADGSEVSRDEVDGLRASGS